MNMNMRIGELAQHTGISTKTIRYYEAVGLLPRPQRTANQYRLYTEHDVMRLRFIIGARSLGYSVADIAQLLVVSEKSALPCQQVLASLDVRLRDIERRMVDLQAVHDTLEHIRRAATSRPPPVECDDQCVCYLLMKGNAMQSEKNSTETSTNQVILACNPNAIPADRREQWAAAGKQVYAAVQEVRDLPDGYGFRLPADPAMLFTVAEYINNERLCCAFVHFTIEFEAQGPLWLYLTGGEGVKAYMRSLFAIHDLLALHLSTK
jgi:DNA-binding transcriptional MerR regulator